MTTPILISNTRPGFVPFSAHPIPIAGMVPRSFAPVYRPAPYTPPMISGPAFGPEMGQLPFPLPDIQRPLLLGGGGAAALLLAGAVPTPAKELMTIGGIVLIGLGAMDLLSGATTQKSEIPPEEVPAKVKLPSSGKQPVVPPGTMAQMFTLAMDQSQSQTGGTTRQMYSSQEYEYNLLNKTQNEYSFFVGAEVRDTPDQTILFRSNPDDPGVAGRKRITIPGKGQIRPSVYVPALAPNTIFWPQSVTVQVALFQNLRDAEPAMMSAPVTIKYAWIG